MNSKVHMPLPGNSVKMKLLSFLLDPLYTVTKANLWSWKIQRVDPLFCSWQSGAVHWLDPWGSFSVSLRSIYVEALVWDTVCSSDTDPWCITDLINLILHRIQRMRPHRMRMRMVIIVRWSCRMRSRMAASRSASWLTCCIWTTFLGWWGIQSMALTLLCRWLFCSKISQSRTDIHCYIVCPWSTCHGWSVKLTVVELEE